MLYTLNFLHLTVTHTVIITTVKYLYYTTAWFLFYVYTCKGGSEPHNRMKNMSEPRAKKKVFNSRKILKYIYITNVIVPIVMKCYDYRLVFGY